VDFVLNLFRAIDKGEAGLGLTLISPPLQAKTPFLLGRLITRRTILLSLEFSCQRSKPCLNSGVVVVPVGVASLNVAESKQEQQARRHGQDIHLFLLKSGILLPFRAIDKVYRL